MKFKWNWLDTVIVCVVAVLLIGAAAFFLWPRGGGVLSSDESYLYVTFDTDKARVGTYDDLKVGDKILLTTNGKEVGEIVSGGAKGVDTCAADYAKRNYIKLTEFFPDYNKYGRSAPLKRNESIAEYADEALAFWGGASRGTQYTIKYFERLGKKVTVIKHP
jgi:predicted Rossmann fold nucleotide-binding protein DprA/Smf involved in DNA uptake